VMQGGSCDRSGLQLAVRGEHLLDRTEALAPELTGYRVGATYVRIDHSQQAHGFALLFEFLVDSGVIAPENADTNHRDGNRVLR
jgi:hypothetical protein